MPQHRKKLIEVALPLEAINKASAREKSIRHGHLSTLHFWWARRPLAACRAVIFTSPVDDPGDGRLRFIEVEGRKAGARTVTVTKNEILTGFKQPEQYILALVGVDEAQATPLCYVRRPFEREPELAATSVNYDLRKLLARSTGAN